MFSQSDTFRQKQQSLNEAVLAGEAALDEPHPHRRSPAFAIQVLAAATYFQVEPEGYHPRAWLCHVFQMSGQHAGRFIRWEEYANCWSSTGDYSISGASILKDVAFWQKNGLDMSRSPRDQLIYPEDEALVAQNPNAIAHIEKSLMPLERELLRRRFEVDTPQGKEMRYFDVWVAEEQSGGLLGLFHWKFHSPATPDPIACSSTPIPNHELEGLVAPRFLPDVGCERYLI